MIVLKFVGVLVLVALLDFIWAQYIKHAANASALKSASYAMLISLFSGMVTIAYVGDHVMILAAVAGAIVGTYLSAKFSQRANNARKEAS